MQVNRSAKKRIIRESYVRLALVSAVTMVTASVCGFIDNIIIGRFLGDQALAAVGYFSPLSVVTGLCYVIIMGAASLCGNYIGAGQPRKINALFTSAFATIAAFYLVFALALVAAGGPIAGLLGAWDEARGMLRDYLAGYAPCVMFSALNALLMSLASYNNAINRTYAATGVMILTNAGLDALLAKPMGLLGIGLASSMSSLAAFAVLLPVFVKKRQTVRFEKDAFDPGLVLAAARRGLPNLLFTGGMLVKNSLINYALTVYVGYEGVAVANILGSVCGIAGAIGFGCHNAFLTLASLYWGEEDREGLVDAFRLALAIGLISTALLVAAIAVCAVPLSNVFFNPGSAAHALAQGMFRLGFLFFPINLVFNLLMSGYKAQGRMTLVNVMSFVETAMIGVFAVLTAPRSGANAVWLANTWSDLLALAVVVASVFIWKKGISLRAADLLKLPEDFGAGPDEFVEYAVKSLNDLAETSRAVVAFCELRSLGKRTAFLTGLCVEEIAGNALSHGASPGKRPNVNVRVVCKGELTVRVQDDCRKFDPRERMNMYTPDTPERNLGLRLVARSARQIDYYNNAGINTMIMKV